MGCCSSCSSAGITPSPNLATAERTPLHVPPLSPKGLYPPQPKFFPPPHWEQAAYCSEPPFLILMAKAKKAQAEGRKWLQGLEGDGPSEMSPPRASPGYLHMERERPSSVQAEGAAVRVAGH